VFGPGQKEVVGQKYTEWDGPVCFALL
jgi:hypothetical protein